MTTDMTIHALAAAARTSADTVRYYERIGVLPAPSRGTNNYRRYGPQAVGRLQFVLACRDLDMSIEEIMALLKVRDTPQASCEAVTRVIDDHLSHVRQRIKTLKHLQSELQMLRQACEGHGEGADCGTLQALEQRAPELARKRVPSAAKSHLR